MAHALTENSDIKEANSNLEKERESKHVAAMSVHITRKQQMRAELDSNKNKVVELEKALTEALEKANEPSEHTGFNEVCVLILRVDISYVRSMTLEQIQTLEQIRTLEQF